MNFNEYQSQSNRTAPDGFSTEEKLANYAMGLSGETGEIIDHLKKVVFHLHDLDKVYLEKEIGDVLWYLSQIAFVANISLDHAAIGNIEKLKRRYPDGFSGEDSRNRTD